MAEPVQTSTRDHGGGLDAVRARYGGARGDWLDLSTGINPLPYPIPPVCPDAWTALPDTAAAAALTQAARTFWRVPDGAGVLAAPGVSALIARVPLLRPQGHVRIAEPTYNEHAAAFAAAGWNINGPGAPDAQVVVHPNNPDGRRWRVNQLHGPLRVIDESFCDICPDQSLVRLTARPDTIVLKSFGKFWGLAGMRLGFAIAAPATIAALKEMLGPWPVSGPALAIGTAALQDHSWATRTRARLTNDALRLDRLATRAGAKVVGGTPLFRLYQVADAAAWQNRLARHQLWSRIFPYSTSWIRLGLPPADGWHRVERAL